MLTKYIFSVIFFLFTLSINAQVDDVHINVRLFPIQMLAVDGDRMNIDHEKGSLQEINSVIISSPSGFQLKVQHDHREDYDLINSSRGVVGKRFKIHQMAEGNISTWQNNSNHMILTLISQ